MDEGDSKSAMLPDGISLGKVSKTRGRSTPAVVNEMEFCRWVKENYPSEIEETVRPAFRTKMLDTAKAYGEAIDPSTGEVIPGVEYRHGDPYISFRSERGFEQVVAARWEEIAGPALLQGGDA